jgi:hypothetical protein
VTEWQTSEKKLKNPLDNPHKVWYNECVKRGWKPSPKRLENEPPSGEENSQKKVEKTS